MSTTTIQEQLVSQIAQDMECVKSVPLHHLFLLRLLMTNVSGNTGEIGVSRVLKESKQSKESKKSKESNTQYSVLKAPRSKKFNPKNRIYPRPIHQPRSNQLGFKKNHRKS